MTTLFFPQQHQSKPIPRTDVMSSPLSVSMTQLAEVPMDPCKLEKVRQSLEIQPDAFYFRLFGGRLPSWEEKNAHIEEAVSRAKLTRSFENNIYHVEMVHTPPFTPPFIHLVIRRHDWVPVKNWAHFQQIKNEIVGPENEAVELFPAESRLVDAAHLYHLWVHSDPKFRFPIGWSERFVCDQTDAKSSDAGTSPIARGCVPVRTGIPVGRLAIL
jgi:hypothetical protein